MDENKKEAVLFWALVTLDYPPNLELITSNSIAFERLTTCFIKFEPPDHFSSASLAGLTLPFILFSLQFSNERSRSFNASYLPTLYKMFQACARHSEAYAEFLMNHHNFRWAFETMCLNNIIFPEVCLQRFFLCS